MRPGQAAQTAELCFSVRQQLHGLTSKQQWSTVTGLRVMHDLTIAPVTSEELRYQHE